MSAAVLARAPSGVSITDVGGINWAVSNFVWMKEYRCIQIDAGKTPSHHKCYAPSDNYLDSYRAAQNPSKQQCVL